MSPLRAHITVEAAVFTRHICAIAAVVVVVVTMTDTTEISYTSSKRADTGDVRLLVGTLTHLDQYYDALYVYCGAWR